ncbi:MAG TPA: carbonic anhydrase [Gammaproteobacteria bacterium]|nr:carbonic anhydrase [Gammaproteobacteria bacterium]
MGKNFNKVLQGYQAFRAKYALGDSSVMHYLSNVGQQPKIMVVACCDSRVDPALILQCEPGDLFVVRNVANIVPPYEKDDAHHGTSAALEFGVRFLEVENLILLGHSQCGGIQALLKNSQNENDNDNENANRNDFINNWVSLIKTPDSRVQDVDACAKSALQQSYQNCLTFPWLLEKVKKKKLAIHLWFFDIGAGEIFTYLDEEKKYQPLGSG